MEEEYLHTMLVGLGSICSTVKIKTAEGGLGCFSELPGSAILIQCKKSIVPGSAGDFRNTQTTAEWPGPNYYCCY